MKAQEKLFQPVHISFEEGTIEQYLDTIQSQIGTGFVYSSAITPHRQVTITKGVYKVNYLLDSLFSEQSVLYIERRGQIILSPQSPSSIENDKVIVKGRVTGRKGQVIPFATIYIQNKSLGTISNAEGVFKFVLPSRFTNDTLTITSLGYKNKQISPDQYLTNELEVKLEVENYVIRDVIVRPVNPVDIVKGSFNARGKNYATKPTVMNAFFRESSKQDENYISLSEALIEIKKNSYTNEKSDLIRFVKGRNGTNITQSELVNLVVEGGLYNGLRLDVAKYGSYFYNELLESECDYKLHKTIIYGNRQTYVIKFVAKEGIKYPGYNGTLYIDAESLALVRAEFELGRDGIRYARSLLVKKAPRGYRVKPVHARYEVEYRFYNNVWNLHYARSDFGIKVKKVRGKENKGFSCDFSSTSEFVITGISDTTKLKIPFRELSKPSDVLVEQVKNTPGNFWLEDNVILPEEPLLSTIRKLQLEGELPKDDAMMTKDD